MPQSHGTITDMQTIQHMKYILCYTKNNSKTSGAKNEHFSTLSTDLLRG